MGGGAGPAPELGGWVGAEHPPRKRLEVGEWGSDPPTSCSDAPLRHAKGVLLDEQARRRRRGLALSGLDKLLQLQVVTRPPPPADPRYDSHSLAVK